MTKKILFSILVLFAIATTAQAQENSVNGHEYVDLGLPSGLLWATCNVGATKPEEYGDYFAWGETTKKENYSWDTYKWGTENALTKYTESDKTTLDPEDDAATAKWGGKWRMPTLDEIKELLDNITKKWTTQNGVNGYEFTAKNGNSIFLPASGFCDGGSLNKVGSCGICWSSSLYEEDSAPFFAYFLDYNSDYAEWTYSDRSYGLSVRPVISKGDISGIEANSREPIANDRYYTLDGKKLSGEPTQKGVYINKGKKVVK